MVSPLADRDVTYYVGASPVTPLRTAQFTLTEHGQRKTFDDRMSIKLCGADPRIVPLARAPFP
ncbi:MAG: hypothetical protein LBB38_01775 [Puniceicoccales bacterium]|nr:hypothetical protein [Puniceicoccales bacterium]